MSGNGTFDIFHACSCIADFDGVTVKNLVKGFAFGKCLSISRRKSRAMFERTFLLKGGLNQLMFLCRFRCACWKIISRISKLITVIITLMQSCFICVGHGVKC